MKMKKVLKSAVIGASMLAMVGTAHAGKAQVNLYGASAQYKFWTSAAPAFMLDKGCAAADVYVAVQEDACASGDRDMGVAVCAGPQSYGGTTGVGMDIDGDGVKETVVFTYTTYASYEGINAVKGTGDPDACNSGNDTGLRLLPDDTAGMILVNYAGNPLVGSIANCACLDVVLGASDVKPETFMQDSHGEKKGPCLGGWYDSSVYNYSIPTGFIEYEPIVVPFSFFVNAQDNHTVPFDNLSREMVLLLYSRAVMNWNFFNDDLDGDGTAGEPGAYLADGSGGDSLPVVLCLRHAGSGTHATFGAGVLRGDINMPTMEDTSGWAPLTYFNKGSSDMMRCIGGGCGTANPSWTGYGAIGYADSDKCCGDVVGVAACGCKGGFVKRVEYQGHIGDRENIKMGKYAFWAAQHIYQDSTDAQELKDLSSALMTYAADPANIPTDRADWWAAQGEMKVKKTTDFTMPAKK